MMMTRVGDSVCMSSRTHCAVAMSVSKPAIQITTGWRVTMGRECDLSPQEMININEYRRKLIDSCSTRLELTVDQIHEHQSNLSHDLRLALTRASNSAKGKSGSCSSLKNSLRTPAIELMEVESVTSARGSSPAA